MRWMLLAPSHGAIKIMKRGFILLVWRAISARSYRRDHLIHARVRDVLEADRRIHDEGVHNAVTQAKIEIRT